MPRPRIGRPEVVHPIVPKIPIYRSWKDKKLFGSRRRVLYALQSGGKTLAGLVREKGLRMTHQRARLLLSRHYGILLRDIKRDVGWYARHLGKPELVHKDLVQKKLETFGLAGFARILEVTEPPLRKICRMHGIEIPRHPPQRGN